MKLISKKTLLLFFLPGAIFMGMFLIYPIIKMVIDSGYKIGITGNRTFIGLDNYIKAFSGTGMLKQLKNTLVYILVAVSVETILGFVFALLFELNYKGSKIVRSLMMTPLMIAPLVAGLIWKLMLSSSFGIVNEILTRIGILKSTSGILWLADPKWSLFACCIADIWLTTPFMMLMILAGLQGIPHELYEAAELDGAGLWKKFTNITMPALRPVTYYVMVNMIIGSFNVFIQVMMLTSGGPNGRTATLQYLLYDKAFNQFAFGEASAIGLISAVTIVVLTTVLNKRLNLDTENEEESA